MAGSIKLYTLGHSGVIIDQNPLEPGVPDDSFQIAQNMTHDLQDGKGGAVCKRPGLAKFNQIALGGAILGGIPMPVAGLGKAPATGGGGDTGSNIGTGDGTGRQGGTFDGGTARFGSVGSSIFGGGALFNGARLIVIGQSNTATTNDGIGWYVTSKQMANAANDVTTPGPPGLSAAAPLGAGELIADTTGTFLGRPFAISADNFLYYVKAATILSNVTHQIRRTNGVIDVAVATVVNSSVTLGGGSVVFQSVPAMCYGEDGAIYLTTVDEYGSHTTGRIMKISGGVISEVNPGGPGTILRYARVMVALATFEGRLFWGTIQGVNDTSSEINCTTLDQTYSLSDFAPGADQRYSGITCMLNSGGILYAGTRIKTAGTAQRAVILVRVPGAVIGASGNWTTVDINIDPANPTPADRNCFVSMVAFNGDIYASWYNPSDRSTIYRLTPGLVSGVQQFSGSAIAYTSTAAADRVGYELFVDSGVLYAIGQRTQTSARKFMWSSDGVTWTDASSNFTLGTKYPHPILYGLDQ